LLRRLSVPALCCALALATFARAEEAPADAPAIRAAAGLGLGAGVRASSADLLPIGPELGLPAFELALIGPRDRSVELSVPVLRMVASPLLVERIWIGFDVYRCFRQPLAEGVSAVAGPGAGWMMSTAAGNGTGGVRLAGRVGLELEAPEGDFATAFLVQPYGLFEFGDIGAAVSGGAMLWVRWTWSRKH